MIVSDLESVCLRVLLGGILDANQRGVIDANTDPWVQAFLDALRAPGETQAAREEIAMGKPVHR